MWIMLGPRSTWSFVVKNTLGRCSAAAHLGIRVLLQVAHAATALGLAVLVAPSPLLAQRYTPTSPQVRELVAKGLAYLETTREVRLGGQCLMGLAFLKAGQHDHRRVHEALAACREMASKRPEQITTDECDIYSTGLAIIFLATLDAGRFRGEIQTFLRSLELRQKPAGGWGYPDQPTGDTSMTQYGVLASWEAARAGATVSRESIRRVCEWLLRTQDPAGGWGYQGEDPGNFVLIPQRDVRHSLSAAGLGSIYICADLLGISGATRNENSVSLPSVVTPVGGQTNLAPHRRINVNQLRRAQQQGTSWMRANYRIDPEQYTHYYLYALERYQSFRDLAENRESVTASWYDDGVRYLARTQDPTGYWQSECGAAVDTAFSLLFLLRSSKQSIEEARSFGDGRLVGGRGLPSDTSQVDLQRGAVVRRRLAGPGEELANAIQSTDDAELFYFATNLPAIPDSAWKPIVRDERVLERALDSRSPEARLLVAAALGSSRDLNHVPRLIRLLRDEDWRVVRQANEGLKRIARQVAGFELPPQPAESDRQRLIDQWRTWYGNIRPGELID